MTENIIRLREVVASPGKILTNGEIYGPVLYLGINESTTNFYEITEAEYAEILKAEAEALNNGDNTPSNEEI